MRYLIGCLLVWFSVSVSADDQLQYECSSSQNTVTITLKANATTGYQWAIKHYDKKLLTKSTQKYLAPTNTQLMGASGIAVFNFSIKAGVARPKATTIQFVYRRPWEPNSGKVKTVIIQFKK